MSLVPASRLGPYEIMARLGAGAMGEVYRARDTRLGREVAIKILPADVAHDAGRRTRFEQEARSVAALNHPNILGLYDIGSENDLTYIVTELVRGESLAESLVERGPLPTKKLLDVAVQIADGMAAAHAAGITHRDLKPANIMISADGRVKILDFGLAKQTQSAAGSGETMTVTQTTPGIILGTINYMSPEQARGRPIDRPSDQFSFGVILYEMTTGKKAFARPEAVQTMAAIVSEEAPPIERDVPAPLRWVIDRCLAKEPVDRYESSLDLYRELRGLRDHLSEALIATPNAAGRPRRRRLHLAWQAAVGFMLGVTLAALSFREKPEMTDQSAYQYTPFSFLPGRQCCQYWSPDGKAVAYAVSVAGVTQIFIRYLDQPTPVQLTHSATNTGPKAWTSDGKRLLIDVDGDSPGIWSLATVGGEPQVVVPKIPQGARFDAETISPDNRTVAFFYSQDDRYGVWIASPLDAKPVRYQPEPYATKDLYNGASLKFSPDGKQLLLFVNGDEGWLLPYPPDPKRPPHRVLPDLKSRGPVTFGWMPDSRRVVVSFAKSTDAPEQLWLADLASGRLRALTSGTVPRTVPAVAPDGRRLIFHESSGNFDIVSVDLANAAVHSLIATERDEVMPAWAAKQPALVYVTNRNGLPEIWLHNSTGDRPLVTAHDFPTEETGSFMGPALSPEADRVVYCKITPGARENSRLWISAVTGGAPVPLTNDNAPAEVPGSWSLDGSWFAYVNSRNGKLNLLKVKSSGQATPIVVKEDVDYDNDGVPSWSPDGSWIVLGESLYSSDGKTVRPLGNHKSEAYTFSPDGKLVYGMRPERERELLFSVDIASRKEKIIGDVGKDSRPGSNQNPAMRFSLAPGAKGIVYGTIKRKDNLWLLEGFAAKTGFWARLGL